MRKIFMVGASAVASVLHWMPLPDPPKGADEE